MVEEKLPKVDYSRAVSNTGDRSKIIRVMKKAMAGESITVGFIGGSITQGSLASAPDKCYACRVYEWFKESFPASDVKYVNAGIGATDSQFGCARAESDLLSFKPDMCFAEFSVNDASNEHFHETYEGLVRKILAGGNRALMLIHNVRYDDGGNAQLMHSKVARKYDVPSVSMQQVIYPELENGNIDNRLITPDDLHPNDLGHALVSSVIISVLDEIKKEAVFSELSESIISSNLPSPETLNAYENSIRYRNDSDGNIVSEISGFVKDEEPQNDITDIFKKGWIASDKGSYITFKVKGSCIAVQYRKTIQKPAPAALVIIDGDRENAKVLDADFEETWGDKLCIENVMEHGEKGEHTVRIELDKTHDRDALPFYLVSVIVSG